MRAHLVYGSSLEARFDPMPSLDRNLKSIARSRGSLNCREIAMKRSRENSNAEDAANLQNVTDSGTEVICSNFLSSVTKAAFLPGLSFVVSSD